MLLFSRKNLGGKTGLRRYFLWLSMQHYVQADLLSLANFINVALGSSSWQCRRTWKEKQTKLISLNYTLLPANSKVRQIWKSLKRLLPDSVFRCVLCDARTESEVIATRPYSAMLDACAVITALTRRPENNF